MFTTKIKAGDTVVITHGKDRGKTGKILRIMPKNGRIIIDGLNLRTKHVRGKKQGEKGQRVKVPGSINIASVKIICSNCKRGVRLGFEVTDNGKNRICRSCRSSV